MRLFDTGKVGLFCDKVDHSTERRNGDEVKVLVLTLRCQPFDAKLATSVADVVRQDLFKLNYPDPKPEIARLKFALGVPRQQMAVFAAPDTSQASISLDQAKIYDTYARIEKNVNGFAFVFKASFGPVSKDELQYCEEWRLGQRFVTFTPAEPMLEFEDDGQGDDADDDEEETQAASGPRPHPQPEFETDATGAPLEASAAATEPEPARPISRRHAGKPPRTPRTTH